MLSKTTSGKLATLFLMLGTAMAAQARPQDSPVQGQAPPTMRGEESQERRLGDGPAPLIGKILSVKGNLLELTTPDGSNLAVKITDKTEFRRDRQQAKISDFKAGDMVFVRGEQSADGSVAAVMVAARTGAGPGGPEGGRGFRVGASFGEMGKDYIAGEIKSVDAPKLTVLRTDNVTQTIELNEETSLRKGRDSITMTEIQPGDYLIARGSVKDHLFTPKNVMIVSSERWQRMQEFMGRDNSGAQDTNGAKKPSAQAPPRQ